MTTLYCSPRCGDGRVVADEVCEPPSLSLAADDVSPGLVSHR